MLGSFRFKIGLILCLGAILRLATLGCQSLWLDEAFSYWMANQPWQTILASLPSADTHPPLYYLSLQPMIALGGHEWLLRLPSALAGVASIGLIFALGKELFDQKTAFVAAFIIAISPIQLWYAQEARMYALVTALVLAGGLFAVRALRTNHHLDWLLFGLFEGIVLLTDVSAIWFVLAINTAWLLLLKMHWSSGRFWPWIIAQLLALLIYLPWVPSFLQQLSAAPNWIGAATFTILGRTLTDFVGSYENRSTLGSLFSLVVLLTPIMAALRPLIREASIRKTQYIFLGCWCLIPIGLAFLISQPYFRISLPGFSVGQGRSLFLTRNLIVASIPLVLFLARSLILSPRSIYVAVLIGLIAMSSISYYQNILHTSKEDFRTATQIVREQATEEDLILFAPSYLKIPFSYYWDRSPAKVVSLDTLTDGVIHGPTLQSDTGTVEELISNHQRVWLIMNSDNIYRQDTSKLQQLLDDQSDLLDSQQTYGISILLYHVQPDVPID